MAAFIGDGDLFSGRIEGSEEGPSLVTGDGLRFAVGPGAATGTDATLLLRPEQLEAAPETPDGALGIIEARLEQSVFLGSARKFVCRLANGASLTAAPTGAEARP